LTFRTVEKDFSLFFIKHSTRKSQFFRYLNMGLSFVKWAFLFVITLITNDLKRGAKIEGLGQISTIVHTTGQDEIWLAYWLDENK
jgi:hypothetical protein